MIFGSVFLLFARDEGPAELRGLQTHGLQFAFMHSLGQVIGRFHNKSQGRNFIVKALLSSQRAPVPDVAEGKPRVCHYSSDGSNLTQGIRNSIFMGGGRGGDVTGARMTQWKLLPSLLEGWRESQAGVETEENEDAGGAGGGKKPNKLHFRIEMAAEWQAPSLPPTLPRDCAQSDGKAVLRRFPSGPGLQKDSSRQYLSLQQWPTTVRQKPSLTKEGNARWPRVQGLGRDQENPKQRLQVRNWCGALAAFVSPAPNLVSRKPGRRAGGLSGRIMG